MSDTSPSPPRTDHRKLTPGARFLCGGARIGAELQTASFGGLMTPVAALTELAALRQGEVMVVDDVLASPSLRTIIDELDFAYWRPTEIGWRQASGASNHGVSLGRRSESTSQFWFGEGICGEIALLEERICPALGVTRDHLELWQAARYEVGGYFDAHLDGGVYSDHPAGERAVTLLLYLSNPARGGSTLFPELSLEVHARAGRLVAWRNLLADGSINSKMAHAGQLVEAGSKTILMTWVRERPIRKTEPD
ncbi:2OG-Fe(II) oxygenase [Streptomyces sp. NPDC127178]|uniref:2OG-Fe(II) oxygenase n=1 Tax=unclassified Streptomyces TaxID=2593676 RepID=UPI0036448CE8